MANIEVIICMKCWNPLERVEPSEEKVILLYRKGCKEDEDSDDETQPHISAENIASPLSSEDTPESSDDENENIEIDDESRVFGVSEEIFEDSRDVWKFIKLYICAYCGEKLTCFKKNSSS